MSPADHEATPLRERLDRLASSVSAGSGAEGAELYRRSRGAGAGALPAPPPWSPP